MIPVTKLHMIGLCIITIAVILCMDYRREIHMHQQWVSHTVNYCASKKDSGKIRSVVPLAAILDSVYALLPIISVVEWKLWSAVVQWRRTFLRMNIRLTRGGRTNLGMTLRSVKVFMYVVKNTGVQSIERTDFMNEVLLLLHVHYRNVFVQEVPNYRMLLYELFLVYLNTCPIINHYAATRILTYLHNW